MDNLTLNLGQFNQCADYIPNSATKAVGRIEYPINSESQIFYMEHHHDKVVSAKIRDCVTVPTFDIGVAINDGHISDPHVANALLAKMELEVFRLLHETIRESGSDLKFDRIMIPIRSIEMYDDTGKCGCYGWVDVGIAVMVPRSL